MMDSVFGVVLALAVLLLYGFLLGSSFCALFRKKERAEFRLLLGMLLFLAVFSVTELPVEKLGLPFHVLVYVQTGVFLALFAACVVFCAKQGVFREWKTPKTPELYMGIFLLLILLQIIYGMSNGGHVNEYDTSYYNGHALNAIYTDTMYQYNARNGQYIGLETYQHDSYPMLIAYLAKIFSMHPLVVVNRVLGVLEIVLTNLIVYETAGRLSKMNRRVMSWTAVIYAGMSIFCWQADRGRFFYLWQRMAESKSMLANVYLPFALLAIILLVKEGGELYYWWILMLAVVVGFSLSVSGIFVMIVMIGSGLMAILLYQRKWRYLLYSVMSVLPGVVIGIVRLFL